MNVVVEHLDGTQATYTVNDSDHPMGCVTYNTETKLLRLIRDDEVVAVYAPGQWRCWYREDERMESAR